MYRTCVEVILDHEIKTNNHTIKVKSTTQKLVLEKMV